MALMATGRFFTEACCAATPGRSSSFPSWRRCSTAGPRSKAHRLPDRRDPPGRGHGCAVLARRCSVCAVSFPGRSRLVPAARRRSSTPVTPGPLRSSPALPLVVGVPLRVATSLIHVAGFNDVSRKVSHVSSSFLFVRSSRLDSCRVRLVGSRRRRHSSCEGHRPHRRRRSCGGSPSGERRLGYGTNGEIRR